MSAMLKEIEKIHDERREEERGARIQEYRHKIMDCCFRAIGYASEAGAGPASAEVYIEDAMKLLKEAQTYAILLGEMQ